MERTILHSDLNGFFASVECMLDPTLRDKAVAVCGSAENRHGIVLAKSEKAKAFGIVTGEATWQAQKKCPGLTVVPPHYEQYLKYSLLTREIYARFTDRIEPYGIDEAWLDLTGTERLFGNGEKAANTIRETVKNELGLTVSIGVSFNKVFAKLCSDMKKPDAVTVVGEDRFRDIIWKLPAKDMLFVGRSVAKRLAKCGVYTIGDLAATPVTYLEFLFGKVGVMIWRYANGLDISRVADSDYEAPIKSVGHGITTSHDLKTNAEVFLVFRDLSQEVSRRLREGKLCARRIQITVRDNLLHSRDFQATLPHFTQLSGELSASAYDLFVKSYRWENPVRTLTVRAINLIPDDTAEQLDLFCGQSADDTWAMRDKRDRAEKAVLNIRSRFGEKSICEASLLDREKWMSGRPENTMPSYMHR